MVALTVPENDLLSSFDETETEVTTSDPFFLFSDWLTKAGRTEVNDANAMALATADANGLPNVRMVLLKGHDHGGIVFFTNSESQKGFEISANPQAAAVFHWKSLRRQVRFRGPIQPVSDDEADAYFESRPRASKIGAWASQQSRPLHSRQALRRVVIERTLQFAVGEVHRPPYWGGFRLSPTYVEFWEDRPFRLHDRIVFKRPSTHDAWSSLKLFP